MNALIKQAARIISQVQDVSHQLRAQLGRYLIHRVDHGICSALIELSNSNHAHIALGAPLDRTNFDDRARNGYVETSRAFSADGQENVGARFATKPSDRLQQRHALDRITFDVSDNVSSLDPGSIGRGGPAIFP